jgi:hypothetical protein
MQRVHAGLARVDVGRRGQGDGEQEGGAAHRTPPIMTPSLDHEAAQQASEACWVGGQAAAARSDRA